MKYQLVNRNFSLLKELVSKFVYGVQKCLSVTFHVQRSSCVIGWLGDNHYQLIMRQHL